MTTPSLKSRAGYFGLGPVLVSILLGFCLTVICWPHLIRHEKYPDPAAGAISWSDLDKSRDIRALVLLITSTVVLTAGISFIAHTTVPQGPGSDLGIAVNQFLLFSLVPAGWRLAIACMNLPDQVPPIRFIGAFPLGAVLVLILLNRFRGQLQAGNIFVVGGAMLLAPVMAGFSALGIVQMIARLIPQSINHLSPYVSNITSGVLIAVLLAMIIIFIVSSSLDHFRKRLLSCLMLCQFPLPLLLFYLVPPPLVDLSRQFATPYPKALVITLGLLAIGGIYCIFRQFKRCNRALTVESPNQPQIDTSTHSSAAGPAEMASDLHRPLANAISACGVASIAIFLFCGTLGLPTISIDFFHAGEVLLPWQQIREFHAIPYVDFAPVHGLMEIIRGIFNDLFFNGAIGTYPEADVLLNAVAAAVTIFAASTLLSPLSALFLLLAVMPDMDRMYFVAPPLMVIASAKLLAKPVRWLAIWLAMGAVLCAYNPAMGPAFVLGTLPAAVWQTYRSFRADRWLLGLLLACCAAIGAVVLAVPVLKQILMGFLQFIVDNQWTNECINGIAWSQGDWKRNRLTGFGSTQLFWEAFRFSWIPVAFAAAAIHWKQWSKPREDRNLSVMVLSASVPPILLWSCLWVIERIDPQTLGRSGTLSLVAVFLITPMLVFLLVPKKQSGVAVLLLAIGLGFIYPNGTPTPLDPDLLVQKPAGVRVIPADARMIDGNAMGFPHMGQVIKPEPDFTSRFVRLRKDMTRYLKPGETFFDLTDSMALYYYMNMRYPAQYAAYVAGNARLQGVMMRQFQKNPVPVILISPCAWLDDVPMSLRCYAVYHDYSLKYAVVNQDEFLFMVDPSRVPEAGPTGSEIQLQMLDSVFRKENLQRLPMAWGNSWTTMANRFTTVAKVPGAIRGFQAGQFSPVSWSIPPQASSGCNADFLRLHLDLTLSNASGYKQLQLADPLPPATAQHSAEPQFCLTWTGPDNKPSAPILFKGATGDLLIPLGIYPRWLLGKSMPTMTLNLQNPECVKQLRVSGIEYLQLQPL